jgi:antitoxin ParD1/3/4
MTVKSTVSFTDRHHAFAQNMVKEGSFASVSSVVAQAIDQLMQDENDREAALEAMQQAIAQRLATPKSEWVDVESDLFDKIRNKLAAPK